MKRGLFPLYGQRDRLSRRDKIHLDTILESIFWTTCPTQRIVGDIETDYSAWLNYHASLGVCSLPNVSSMQWWFSKMPSNWNARSVYQFPDTNWISFQKIGSSITEHSVAELKMWQTEATPSSGRLSDSNLPNPSLNSCSSFPSLVQWI